MDGGVKVAIALRENRVRLKKRGSSHGGQPSDSSLTSMSPISQRNTRPVHLKSNIELPGID